MFFQKKRLEWKAREAEEKKNTEMIFSKYPLVFADVAVGKILSVREEQASVKLLDIFSHCETQGPGPGCVVTKVLLLHADGRMLYELGYETIKPQRYPSFLPRLRSTFRRETVELALAKCNAEEVEYVLEMTCVTLWKNILIREVEIVLYTPTPGLSMAESIRKLREMKEEKITEDRPQ